MEEIKEPKATVVSILPYEINDSKPNLYPGNFIIPAGKMVKPGLLAVARSAFYIPMAFGAASLQAFSSPFEVANSIVNDYVGALLSVSEEAGPGLFVENREFADSDEAARLLADKIAVRNLRQRKWFMYLVNLADAEYKAHSNANAISDLQKMAARELNLKDRAWLMDLGQLALNNCPACYTPVNTNAVLCGSCRYVLNPEKYASMVFAHGVPTVGITPPAPVGK